RSRDFDSRDLLQLFLLLIHPMADRTAGGGADGRADRGAGARIARLIADDRADDRSCCCADAGTALRFLVRVVGIAARAGDDETGDDEESDCFAGHSLTVSEEK